MSKLKIISYFIFLSFILFDSFAEDKITVITENYPPLNYVHQGKLSGAAVEIVDAIQQQMPEQLTIEILPWKRAYLTTLNTPNTILFSMSKSVERKNKFKWLGPIAKKKYAFYALADSPIKLLSLNDAAHYLIGVINGSINEEFLLAKGLNTLNSVNSPLQNLSKLMKGRIDLWYTSTETMVSTLKAMNIDADQLSELFMVQDQYLYIGFNIKTPDHVLHQWQDIYKKLHKSGVIKNIYKNRNELHMYPETMPN